jgi:phosphate-selective porin OprO/OprP
MRLLYVLFFILFISSYTFAQEDLQVKKKPTDKRDNDVKLSVLPYYNYGKGLGMTSPDSIFQLNIRFRIQNRAEYIEDDKSGFGAYIRRLRLRLDGYVGNPKFLYALQLSFAPDDVGEIQEGKNINIIRDAVIFYRPSNNWTFGFGQTKLPGNRQRVNSSGALQLPDRSINNAKFNLDRDFGFQINQLNEYKDRFSYNFKGAISTGNGRNTTVDGDMGLAYTAKVELFPLGAFTNSGSTFEGDLKRETSPKVLLSAVYHYNDKAIRSQGTLGHDLSESRSLRSFLADAVFKYQGFSAMLAYMDRNAKDAVVKEDEYVFTGKGWDYQLSYLFPSNYEIISRVSTQKAGKEIHSFTPHQNQYSVGLTKYIWEHAFKLQIESGINQYKYSDGKDRDGWFTRFQIEMGI